MTEKAIDPAQRNDWRKPLIPRNGMTEKALDPAQRDDGESH
jgi:hypothetical protein